MIGSGGPSKSGTIKPLICDGDVGTDYKDGNIWRDVAVSPECMELCGRELGDIWGAEIVSLGFDGLLSAETEARLFYQLAMWHDI